MKKFLYAVVTDQTGGKGIAVLKGFLWILSKVYGVLIGLRKSLYQIGLFSGRHLPAPVVSIGNLTLGGVGKTPLVAFIAKHLKEKGVQPVILLRGYMGHSWDHRNCKSDEARMLQDNLSGIPVLIGPDRAKNALAFSKENKVDVFLLDDGFQHWRVARQLDVLAIDATDSWGNGFLLPRGILREPKNALSRADIFILTKVDLAAEGLEALRRDLKNANPEALIVEAVHEPVDFSDLRSGECLHLETIRSQKIIVVCAIGSPDSFKKTLENLGADVREALAFMDHYSYEAGDIDRMVGLCEETGAKTIVTTEKDAVKLRHYANRLPGGIGLLSLKVQISIVSQKDQFLERIDRIL